MKKIIAILILLFTFTNFAFGASSEKTKNYGKNLDIGLNVTWAVFNKTKNNLTQSDIDKFKEIGFKSMRIRVTDDPKKVGFNSQKEYMEFVDKLVGMTEKSGLIPILSFSPKELNINPGEETVNYEVAYRKGFAKYFAGKYPNMSFDLVIEPGKQVNKKYKYLLDFFVKTVNEIRKVDKNRILMIAGPSRGNPEFMYRLEENSDLVKIMKTDKNLMLQFHFLAAGPFRKGKKSSWSTGTKEEKQAIEDRLKIAVNFGKKYDLPLWFGAWMPGNYNHTYDKGDNNFLIDEQVEFASFFTSLLKKYNISGAINADGQFYDFEKHIWKFDRLLVVKSIIRTWYLPKKYKIKVDDFFEKIKKYDLEKQKQISKKLILKIDEIYKKHKNLSNRLKAVLDYIIENAKRNIQVDKETKIEDINIAFLGDVMIGGRVKDAIYKNGMDYVFSGTTNFLNKKDMVVLNLETTVTNANSKVKKTYTFKADEKHLKGLKGFNENLYVNLANNHIGDFKEIGMLDTIKNLEKFDIGYFGLGKNIDEANSVKIVNVKNTKIGLIGQNCISPKSYKAGPNKIGTAFFDKEILKREIKKAKEKGVDLIILNAHCGIEYSNGPEKRQIDYYHFAIDNGIDLVIGHHPHWYQGIEKYKGKFIFYSLGDYIFDIFRGRRTQEGIIADVFIKNKKIDKINIEAVHIYDFGSTKIATPEQKKIILNELQKISNNLGKIETIKDGYVR